MTNLKNLEDKLEKEDKALVNHFTHISSFKQFLSKFTFLLSTVPPLLIIILVSLFQWKLIHAIILIIIYQITFYWLIETKFAHIVYFAQRAKSLILPYFQKSTI